MKYVLESNNEYLQAFREDLPLTVDAIDRIIRSDFLLLREAIFAHYEINPFSTKPATNPKIKDLDFIGFIEKADVFCIQDLFRRSTYAGEVACLNIKSLLEPVRRTVYAGWASKRGLPLPYCLTAEIEAWEPPKLGTINDVRNIDWEKLSPAVLASIGANSFAQASRRANSKVKISEIYASNLMHKFLQNCAVAEGKDFLKAQDTIREYIEHQFSE